MGILDWLKNIDAEKDSGNEPVFPGFSVEDAAKLLKYFPIGCRLKYFPEFQNVIKLDTLVLGYKINMHFIFSARALSAVRKDGVGVLRINSAGAKDELRHIDALHIIIPHKLRNEVDYPEPGSEHSGEKFTEKTVNDFNRGNAITLFKKGSGGKVPHLTTTVGRSIELKDGYYANTRVVLLEPEMDSFKFLDQRRSRRLYARIPAVLSFADEAPLPCVIQDFSEKAFRVSSADDSQFSKKIIEGVKATLCVKLENECDELVLKCVVHRKTEDYLVLFPSMIERNKRFRDFDPMDELYIKTTLIHHPQARIA